MCLKRPYLAYIIDSLTSTSGYIPIRVKKQDFTVTSASWQNEKTSWSVPLKLQVGQLQFNKHLLFNTQTCLRFTHWDIWKWAYGSKQARKDGEKDLQRDWRCGHNLVGACSECSWYSSSGGPDLSLHLAAWIGPAGQRQHSILSGQYTMQLNPKPSGKKQSHSLANPPSLLLPHPLQENPVLAAGIPQIV